MGNYFRGWGMSDTTQPPLLCATWAQTRARGALEAPPAGFEGSDRQSSVEGGQTPCAAILGGLHRTAEKCHGTEG